jgi:hypothetical protein
MWIYTTYGLGSTPALVYRGSEKDPLKLHLEILGETYKLDIVLKLWDSTTEIGKILCWYDGR